MTLKKPSAQYVDLVISEAKPSRLARNRGQYRFCTLTKRGNQHYINLRLPSTVQERILEAYKQGKVVRIFA